MVTLPNERNIPKPWKHNAAGHWADSTKGHQPRGQQPVRAVSFENWIADGFAYRCKKCDEESRRISVIKSHGLSDNDYYKMINEQDGKCAICNQVANKKGITKLVHSNKDHSYRLPINPDEWWWIHQSCHLGYDKETTWTPERRKKQSEIMKKRSANKSKKVKKSKTKIIKKNSSQVSYWLKN